MGTPFKQAVHNWADSDGNEVRKAALQHEINGLSSDAKRVLLASAFMGEASFTELRQVTGYTNERLKKCLDELNSFFLVETKPFIKKELRFTISENTAKMVTECAETLVIKPDSLKDSIIKLRKQKLTDGYQKRNISEVGAAINQSNAMLRDKDFSSAISTIESALAGNKNNPDLLLEEAICQYEEFRGHGVPSSLDSARTNFKKSYDAGQRKASLFIYWYDAEMCAKDPSTAIEVANLALNQRTTVRIDWLKRKASAHTELSSSLRRALNIDLAIDNLKEAANDIGKAFSEADYLQKPALKEVLEKSNDDLWTLCNNNTGRDIPGFKELFDITKLFIKIGDIRATNYERRFQTLLDAIQFLMDREKAPTNQISLLQNLFTQCSVPRHVVEAERVMLEKQRNELQSKLNDLLKLRS